MSFTLILHKNIFQDSKAPPILSQDDITVILCASSPYKREHLGECEIPPAI